MDDEWKGILLRRGNLYLMLYTALILGLAGSWHCVGMCSPLALAVTRLSSSWVATRLLYNLGRVLTYAALGALFSATGMIFSLLRFQNLFSIIVGITLFLIGVGTISKIKIPLITGLTLKFSSWLKKMFASFLSKKNYGSVFILGALNGLLPCGLTFLALSYCVTLGGSLDGAYFMLVFGLGTLPVMMGVASIFFKIANRLNYGMQNLTNGIFVISGILLIARVFFVHLPHATSVADGIREIVICGK